MDSQRTLLLSDSHGHIDALAAVLTWVLDSSKSGGIHSSIFLGDGASDLPYAINASGFSREWKIVRGNGDHDSRLPISNTFDANGHRFFLSHGHRHALHNGYYSLIQAAGNLKAEAILFGHTHIPCCINDYDVLLINPGSIGRPRSRIGATFAVIECCPGKPFQVEFWGIGARFKIRKLEL